MDVKSGRLDCAGSERRNESAEMLKARVSKCFLGDSVRMSVVDHACFFLCHWKCNFGSMVKCLFGARYSALGPLPNVIWFHQNIRKIQNCWNVLFLMQTCVLMWPSRLTVFLKTRPQPRGQTSFVGSVWSWRQKKKKIYFWNYFSSLIWLRNIWILEET